MDFQQRATKAYERGDAVRAVVLLAEGLKRSPDRRDAAEALVDYYVEGLSSPGLERDVVSGLVETSEAQGHLQEIYRRLVVEGREKMARNFERAAEEVGVEVEREVSVPADEADCAGPPDQTSEPETAELVSSAEPEPSSPQEFPLSSEPVEPAGKSDSEPTEEAEHEAPRTSEADEPPERKVRAVEARGPDGPVEQREADETSRRWPAWLARGAVALAVVGVAAFAVWQVVKPRRAGRMIDEQLEEIDLNTGPRLVETEAWERASGLSSAGRRERRQFAEAVRALEWGEVYEVVKEPTTPWGWSAAAMAALTSDDLERAVRVATRLRRTQTKDHLARVWTNARVAEYRGHARRAERLYRRGRERYPEFVPFVTGALRIAFTQMNRRAVDRLVERLGEASAEHPYRVLADIPFPVAESLSRKGSSATSREPTSAFMRRVRDYELAVDRLAERAYGEAIGHASGLIARHDHFGPALWVRAVASAAVFDVETADKDFNRLVELSGLARAFRWRLRVVAPTLLTRAGRPDLAARYVLAEGGPITARPESISGGKGAEGEEGPEEERSIVSRTSHWKSEPTGASEGTDELQRLADRARLARIRVLVELGHVHRAGRRLERLRQGRESVGRRLSLMRAELEARRGRRPAGTTEWAWKSASPEERLVGAFYGGRFETAIEIGTGMLDGTPPASVLRYVALSYAATDRGRQALQTLDRIDSSLLAAPAIERVRSRIVARLWKGSGLGSRARKRLVDLEPTGTRSTVDLAAIMLWTGRIERAERLSRAAVERTPDYPEGNWMRGLVLRLQGRDEEAERYARRSWRADGEGARLSMELGYVNLALDHPRRARDLFYSALFARPTSIEAIRGLGRAYHRFRDIEGEWNFERIYQNYEQDPSRRLQAAEVQRWLGVFDGVREGKMEGREHLDRAIEAAGERVVLLLELARYHRARGELEKARGLFVDALAKNSTLAEAHLGLAKVAEAAEEPEEMKRHLEQYLDLAPAGREAEWARGKLSR